MWSRAVVAVLIVLVVIVGSGATGATGVPAGGVDQVAPTPTDDGTGGDTREILLVRVLPDGTANWTVVTTIPLDSANRTAAFETIGAAFERGDLGDSPDTFRRAASAAGEATGREMNITHLARSATVITINRTTATAPASDPDALTPVFGGDEADANRSLADETPPRSDAVANESDAVTATTRQPPARANRTRTVGRFVLSFQWTNFANQSDGLLRVGDAFNTSTGTWLPGLAADQTLVLRKPFSYDYLTAPRGPEQGALRWTGPFEFTSGPPSAVYVRRGQQGNGPVINDPVLPPDGPPVIDTPTNTTPTTTAANGTPANGTLSPTQPPATTRSFPPEIAHSPRVVFGIGVLALAVLAALAYGWWRRGRPDEGSTPAASNTNQPPPDGPSRDTPPVADRGDGTRANEATGSTAGARSTSGADADDVLLTDEERVEGLLQRNDGRMRQAEIVTQTDWSNAKVSQLLSSMAEADRVEKLRLGRENLISLPENSDTGGDSEEAADTDGGGRR